MQNSKLTLSVCLSLLPEVCFHRGPQSSRIAPPWNLRAWVRCCQTNRGGHKGTCENMYLEKEKFNLISVAKLSSVRSRVWDMTIWFRAPPILHYLNERRNPQDRRDPLIPLCMRLQPTQSTPQSLSVIPFCISEWQHQMSDLFRCEVRINAFHFF